VDDAVNISWPSAAGDCQVEVAENLFGLSWKPMTNNSVVVGDQRIVTDDLGGPGRFYRLHRAD